MDNGQDHRIGVVGLGRMGSAIAIRLKAKGLRVRGWNRSSRPVEGIERTESLAQLAGGADVLILSLFDDAAVKDVFLQILDLDLHGNLLIETSTIAPSTILSFADRFAEAGCALVDAPISGGPEVVMGGNAGVFLGGSDAAKKRAAPVLSALTDNLRPTGDLGSGYAAKIVNNTLLQVSYQGLIEALRLGRACGLQRDVLLSIIESSPGTNAMTRARMDLLRGTSDRVGFPGAGVFKDSSLFLSVAQSLDVETPALSVLHETLAAALDRGDGAADVFRTARRILEDPDPPAR
ncbi:MAG: NAD(P)-dependent oxidoreductase [Pseudomonadota bacterium]